MYVILDTAAIHHDFHLSNSATRRLLTEASSHGIVVCLPEVVVREMIEHFREQMERTLQAAEKSGRDLARLRLQEPATQAAGDLQMEVAAYGTRLRAILAEHDVLVLPLPNANASALLPRNLTHRKPFKADGKGLNDVLIWESILELCSGSSRPIAVVTGNIKDFADPLDDLVLHLDLQADLIDIGFPEFNAELHKSISSVVEKHLGLPDNGDVPTLGGNEKAEESGSV